MDAKRFENWEQYFAGKVALSKAIEYSLSWGLPAIQKRVYCLASDLRKTLSDINGVLIADQGVEKCGIVTFIPGKIAPQLVKTRLAAQNINVSISEGSGNLVSYQQRNIGSLVRASVHYYNTNAEIEQFAETVSDIVST